MYASLDEIAALKGGGANVPTIPSVPVVDERAVEIPSQPLVLLSNPDAGQAQAAPVTVPLTQRIPWWVWVGGTLALAGAGYWFLLREKPEEDDEPRENPGKPRPSWRDVAEMLHAGAAAKSLVT